MNNKRHQGNLDAITAGIRAQNTQTPVVEIKNFAIAGDGMARVTVEVTHTAASRADHSLISKALEQKLAGRMQCVAGSFNLVDSGMYADRLSGVMSVTRMAIPATETAMKGMTCTASNMFMDDEKDMWVLRKTEAGGLLVKTTGIDDDMTLIGLLESNSSAGFQNTAEFGRVQASASALATSVEGGHFVSYVNLNNQVVHGFVVATDASSDKIVTMPINGKDVEIVSRVAVTEIHDQREFPQVEASAEDQQMEVVAAARGEIDLPFLAEFYKKVYARSPQFYAMFMDRVNQHAFF